MKPLFLTLQAFGSYGERTVIDFTKPNQDLFLITGDTGSGKSTIFDAMVFALYGETGSKFDSRSGEELQSQFCDVNQEPFVEFTFMEMAGGREEQYTVNRVPRHIRAKKKGSGFLEVSGQVSLTMPDGSVYPPKETNEKLMQIVGLTKDQFMQVGMIAQGEFMELLRAKSDEKKVIFRKLFQTQIYQEVVEELAGRRRTVQAELDTLYAALRAETGHAVIPVDYERAKELTLRITDLSAAARPAANDVEEFLEELADLTSWLGKTAAQLREEEERDRVQAEQARDALVRGTEVHARYETLQRARETYGALADKKNQAEEDTRTADAVQKAFEVRNVYLRLEDAKKTLEALREERTRLEKAVPELTLLSREAEEKALSAASEREKASAKLTQVKQQTEQALRIFSQIKELRKKEEAAGKKEQEAAGRLAEAARRREDFEKRTAAWRREEASLQGADAEYISHRAALQDISGLLEETKQAISADAEAAGQKERAEQAASAYRSTEHAYGDARSRYDAERHMFLAGQAGVLAMELKEGEPCPVCGSREHPSPCRLPNGQEPVSREELDALQKEADRLAGEQERAASDCRAAMDLLTEKERNANAVMSTLAEHLRQQNESAGWKEHPDTSISRREMVKKIEKALRGRQKTLQICAESKEKEMRRLISLRDALAGADDTLQKLREEEAAAAEERQQGSLELTHIRSALDTWNGQAVFESEESAIRTRQQAEKAAKGAEAAWRDADLAKTAALTELEKTRSLLERNSLQEPEQEEVCNSRRREYEASLVQHQMTEAEWQKLVSCHTPQDADRLRSQVSAYERSLAAAEGSLRAAEQAVSGIECPDLEALRSASGEASARWEKVQEKRTNLSAAWTADQQVLTRVRKRWETREKKNREYQKLDTLYGLLAGKISGSRMDIETYVQRYYLERILRSANTRFFEMSGGQFALRMSELSQAGEGRNRGLDLIVYSYVTGKTREIRTLSGGESFMAALSLALGMSDQIQSSVSSIHPDVMFIDEGFGSLDDHARNEAVRILQHMSGEHRMIGIISHVSELKQQIEDQLVVTKDEKGSHVHWEIS